MGYFLIRYGYAVWIMSNKIGISHLGLALVVLVSLAACEAEPQAEQTRKEHVWKEQTGAIDKAREVETLLKRKKDQENQ